MNKEVTEVINQTAGTTSGAFNNESSLYISGYTVNDSGYIEIPVIGKVKVLEKTLEEAKEAITAQTLKFLKDPTVIVKLVSFKYSVFGEVLRPGSFINYNNQLTVLEAISQAGNASIYGDLRKITVIRSSEENTQTFRLDLTDRNLLQSEGYYLVPNDIVYVEPVKARNFRNNLPVFSFGLGLITAVLVVMNFFK